MSVYASDVQAIWLLAELAACSEPELIHRALEAYLRTHGNEINDAVERCLRLVRLGAELGKGDADAHRQA